MKLADFIDKYHDGNLAEFARGMGIKSYQIVQGLLSTGGYTVTDKELIKVHTKIPQTELAHIKKTDKELKS